MLDYYIAPYLLRTGISFVAAASCLLQALWIAMLYNSEPQKRRLLPTLCFETVLLAYMIVLSAIPGIIGIAVRDGVVLSAYYVLPRYLLAAVLLAFAVYGMTQKDNTLVLPTAITALTLPWLENRTAFLYLLLTLLAITFYLLRSVRLILLKQQQSKTTLNAASIKEALDFLPSGLLFYEEDGSILLMNHQMHRLMLGLLSKPSISGFALENALAAKHPGGIPVGVPLSVEVLDREMWQFVKTKVFIKKKTYFQLSALNMTDEWRYIHDLEQEQKELSEKSKRLRYFIDNLFQIRYHEEARNTQSKLHDILGQQISLLYHWLDAEASIPKERIAHWAKELRAGLYEPNEKSPEKVLSEILQTFELVQVSIRVEGNLPRCPEVAGAMTKILREAATNAVRHGLATEITAVFSENRQAYRLVIQNNGESMQPIYQEGSGLRSIKSRCAALGGQLSIRKEYPVTLTVTLPLQQETKKRRKSHDS